MGVTRYTAHILIKLAEQIGGANGSNSMTSLVTFADIGRLYFGSVGEKWILIIFCFELFAVNVANVVLAADCLGLLLPQLSGKEAPNCSC